MKASVARDSEVVAGGEDGGREAAGFDEAPDALSEPHLVREHADVGRDEECGDGRHPAGGDVRGERDQSGSSVGVADADEGADR
jgi:hypothetical protein